MPTLDDQSRKMFIGGLSLETTEATLRRFYEQFGNLVDVVVMVDNNSGRSRGFGFVTYSENGCVERALANKPHVIDGKTVDAKPAVPRQDGVEIENHRQKGDQSRKLFIGGLSLDTTEDHLRKQFSQFGDIVDCVVVRDSNTNRSRGFGFVTYATDEGVDSAQHGRPHTVNGKEVETKRAVPRDNNTAEAHLTVNKLFIGGIKDSTTEDVLREHFSSFGTIEKVEFFHDRNSQKRKGFCFVTFDDYDAVDKAVLTPKHHVDGKDVEVKKALSKQEIASKSDGFGGGSGGRGGRGRGRGNFGGGNSDFSGRGGFGGGDRYGGMNSGYGGFGYGASAGVGDAGGRGGYGPSSYGGYGGAPSHDSYGGYSNYGGYGDSSGFGENYGSTYGGGPMRGGGGAAYGGGRNSSPYGGYSGGRGGGSRF